MEKPVNGVKKAQEDYIRDGEFILISLDYK